MAIGFWLLLIFSTVVGMLLCGLPFLSRRYRRRRTARPLLPVTLNTHKAVMIVWMQMQFHLDELEQSGVDVTMVRDNLRETVESVLTAQAQSHHMEPRMISDSILPQNDFPIAVGRFGSLQIFG